MSKLIIEDQRGRRTNIPLARDTVTVGRQEGSTIRLNERNVSRKHLELRRESGVLYVVDVSRFGSVLNTKRFSGKVRLYNGDVLEVGDYKLVVELDEVAPNPRPEVPLACLDFGAARLVRLEQDVAVRTWRVRGPVILGSGPMTDIRISEPQLLREHCVIRPLEHGWLLEVCDPASTVQINERAVQRRILERGDRIQLGTAVFRWTPESEFAVSVDPHDVGQEVQTPRWRRWTAVGLLAESPSMTAL